MKKRTDYMKCWLLLMLVVAAGCGTLNKHKTTERSNIESLDTSSVHVKYNREITTTEKVMVPVFTKQDTAGLSGWLSVIDTSGFFQVVETGTLKVSTTIKPVIKDGRIQGYQVNSSAVKKSESVPVPVTKTTIDKQSTDSQHKTAIITKEQKVVKSLQKEVKRPNPWVSVTIVLCFLILVFFIYKLLKDGIKKRLP